MGNLASAVDELVGIDPTGLSGTALGELIAETRRQINRLEAGYLATEALETAEPHLVQ